MTRADWLTAGRGRITASCFRWQHGMKVTRAMVDAQLRSRYWPGRWVARLLRTSWFSPFALRMGRKRLAGRDYPGLACSQLHIPRADGLPPLRVRVYRPLEVTETLPVMLYLHGGGYRHGVPEQFAGVIAGFIAAQPCVVVAPDYRKASEAPYPAAFDDAYACLLWLRDNAAALGGHGDKFMVAGHSAGGGLAAAVTLKARDAGQVLVGMQVLAYPMLDDRGQTASMRDNNAPVWDGAANAQAWAHYLKGTSAVDAYAAPARASNFQQLPPTIAYVGDIDPFADETRAYCQSLTQAGVPVALATYKGAFHAFDGLVPSAEVSGQARAFLHGNFRDYVQRYMAR